MKKKLFILMSLSTLFLASTAQEPKNKIATNKNNKSQSTKPIFSHQSIEQQTDQIFNKLVEIRRDLHEHPELAGKEIRTQKVIAQYLLSLGLEVDTTIYGHGVLGILKGAKKGKKIVWRSDMDALPQEFPDKAAFQSKTKGIQHGCGHDVHMAIGLGIAEVLSKHKQSLSGTVYFLFQPEEETFLGAKGIINNGFLTKIKPDEVYGLHVTALPSEQIMVKPNEMFAYQRRLRIIMKNELSNQQIIVLTKKINGSLFRVNPNAKPWELQHISDPKIGLMNPNTTFKDYLIIDQNFSTAVKKDQLVLEAYLYETNASKLASIIPTVKQIIKDNHQDEQLISVSFSQENPTILNDEKLTNFAMNTLEGIYGKNVILSNYGQVPFFNDDFAYFQQKVPGVYFFLGGSNLEKGIVAMNHAPNFEVDEASIKTGVKCFSSLIVERLGTN